MPRELELPSGGKADRSGVALGAEEVVYAGAARAVSAVVLGVRVREDRAGQSGRRLARVARPAADNRPEDPMTCW
jgi:hypothetical protein